MRWTDKLTPVSGKSDDINPASESPDPDFRELHVCWEWGQHQGSPTGGTGWEAQQRHTEKGLPPALHLEHGTQE